MIIEKWDAKFGGCHVCAAPPAYKLGSTLLCLLHFSVARNEMAHLVIHEHAFVTKEKTP